MNSKKCKKLRKQSHGNEAQYDQIGLPAKYMLIHGTNIKVVPGIPRTLDPTCSRARYQKLKKLQRKK